MSPGAIDTPDFQKGVVSAQKLLAHVPGGTPSVVVDLPVNMETLVVVADVTTAGVGLTATGGSTGAAYLSAGMNQDQAGKSWQQTSFDISPAMDPTVNVVWDIAPSGDWYVYADAGAHMVWEPLLDFVVAESGGGKAGGMLQVGGWDGSKSRMLVTDTAGQLWTGGATSTISNTGNIPTLGVPPAGFAYRLFTWDATFYSEDTRTQFWWQQSGAGDIGTVLDPGGVNGQVSGDFGGLSLPAGAAVVARAAGGPAPGFYCVLRYAEIPV